MQEPKEVALEGVAETAKTLEEVKEPSPVVDQCDPEGAGKLVD